MIANCAAAHAMLALWWAQVLLQLLTHIICSANTHLRLLRCKTSCCRAVQDFPLCDQHHYWTALDLAAAIMRVWSDTHSCPAVADQSLRGANGTFNYLIKLVMDVPETRAMYLRRLRRYMAPQCVLVFYFVPFFCFPSHVAPLGSRLYRPLGLSRLHIMIIIIQLPLSSRSIMDEFLNGWVQKQFTDNYNTIATAAVKDNAKWHGGDPALGFKCGLVKYSCRRRCRSRIRMDTKLISVFSSSWILWPQRWETTPK